MHETALVLVTRQTVIDNNDGQSFHRLFAEVEVEVDILQ